MRFARRVQRAAASATFAMKAEADRLRAQGKVLVDLGLGEPDCDTPAHIQDAAIAEATGPIPAARNIPCQ